MEQAPKTNPLFDKKMGKLAVKNYFETDDAIKIRMTGMFTL